MWGHESETSIGTLRVRGGARDEPALRLRVGRALGAVELVPRGLPPSAVLMIRRLEDPLPGAFSAKGQPRPDPDWERALRARLEALHSFAVRPQRGWLSADCEAVVFADRAELLACLARDMARGSAWRYWWWQSLLARWPGSLGPSKALAVALGEEIEVLPAVLDHLYVWGEAERVLAALDTGDALALATALSAAFDLQALSRELEDASSFAHVAAAPGAHPHTRGQHRRGPGMRPTDHAGGGASAARGATHHSDAEASQQAPHSAPELLLAELRGLRLGREARLLLAVALVVARRPWQARSASLQRQLVALWRGGARTGQTRDAETVGVKARSGMASSESSEPTGSNGMAGATEKGDANAPSEGTDDRRKQPLPETTRRKPRMSRGNTASTRQVQVLSEDVHAGTQPVTASDGAIASGTAPVDAEDALAPPVLQIHAEDALAPPVLQIHAEEGVAPPVPAEGGCVATEFAGVLYLINLMTALELPECFEADWRLSNRLGPWALLEALGRSLLIVAGVDPEGDALWSAFARLDDRAPREPPGRNFRGAAAYRLPLAWQAQMPADDACYYWAAAGGRLRLWSAEGYLLADVACEAGSAPLQACAELARYGDVDTVRLCHTTFDAAPVTSLERAGLPTELTRFLGFVLPYLRRRLSLALGTPDEASAAAISALLRCRAKVYVTSSHVDLITDLDNTSMPARLAGLDRNPGWLPHMGRVVLFHYD